jgi:hypothetical protein
MAYPMLVEYQSNSGELTTATTFGTGDHLLWLANLILLVVPTTEAAIWFSAHSPLLFLWSCGEYGLTDGGIVVWRWRLCKGITLWTLRVLAEVMGGIGRKRQRDVILKKGGNISIQIRLSLGCMSKGGDVTRRGQLGSERHSHSFKSRRVVRVETNTNLV